MPYRQALRNLPLMKYDMCANGAPPPIQQPVITFQNKYTKRLLRKKKRQLLYFSGSEWEGSNSWHAVPLRILTSRDWLVPFDRHWLRLNPLTFDLSCFFIRQSYIKTREIYYDRLSCWWVLMDVCGGGSRGMLGVVGWPSKRVNLIDSVSVKRFAQERSTLLIAWIRCTIRHSGLR